MLRTKLTSRNNYNIKRTIFRACQAPGVDSRPPPRIGNKNIRNRRIRNRINQDKKDSATVQKGPSEEKLSSIKGNQS